MSPEFAVFVVVVIFVVGWFAVGTHYNVRTGEDALRWLQQGLPLVGEKTTLRWLGSSIVELKIQDAKAPFRNAEVLVVLEPRDVAPFWALARLRGRRDLFVFRGTLRKHPRLELEAYDPKCWTLAVAEKHDGWVALPAPAPLVARAPQQQRSPSEVLTAATLEDCPLVRLTVRSGEPHLELQWPLDQLRRHSSDEVLELVRQVAVSV
jgi:hypothetical protein